MIVFFFMLSSPLYAATYYIAASGSDSNNGTSKSTPWAHPPGLSGCAGNCASHVPSAGNNYILKGGDTWTPSGGWGWSWGGSSGNSIYIGVDSSWYTGGSWSRPKIDLQNIPRSMFMDIGSSYVTLDNIEITNFLWNSSTQAWYNSYIFTNGHDYIVIKNCYFHSWSHTGATDDALKVVLGSSATPQTGTVIQNTIFDGSPSGTDSGMATYYIPTSRNCTVRNMSNGFLPGGSGGLLEVSGSEIGPINWSFDPNQHPNSIEQVGGGTIYIYNNKIHGAVAICIFVGNPGNNAYIFNNLIYDSAPIPIQVDSRGGTGNAYIYNNTIVYSAEAYRTVGTGAWNIVTRNNHIIDATLSPNTSNNLLQTSTQATAAGYTVGNYYAPTNSSAPTVNTGSSLPSPIFTYDINMVARPQGSWDIGSYQYNTGWGGGSIIKPDVPKNLHVN